MLDRYRNRLRQYVSDYFANHPCMDCGETDPLVLDFDHRNQEEKEMGVSRIICNGGSMARLIAEIEKCDVRCANCHRRRHAKDKQVFVSEPKKPHVISPEGIEHIRQPKLGIPRSEETKARISASLQGNHCRKINDLTGKLFGRLWVAGQGEKRKSRIHWICWCACENTCSVAGIKLTTGRTKSCGCLLKEFYGNQHPPIIEGPRDTGAKRNSGAMGQATLQACALD